MITKHTVTYYDCGMPCGRRGHQNEAEAQRCVDLNLRQEAINQARDRFDSIGRDLFRDESRLGKFSKDCLIKTMDDANRFISEIEDVVAKWTGPVTNG